MGHRSHHSFGGVYGISRDRNVPHGFSILELVVVIGIIGIVTGIAATGLRSDFMAMGATTQQTMNAIRMARADAITRGAHYRVIFGDYGCTLQRMIDDEGDGVWEADPDSEEAEGVTWPSGFSVSLEGNEDADGAVVEFDTRGMLFSYGDGPIAEMVLITIAGNGSEKKIEVWPSGQVGLSSETGTTMITGGS